MEGPFKGGGLQKLKSDKIHYLPEAVKLLFKVLKSDWEESNFHASVIEGNNSTNSPSKVVFKFQRDTLDSESALNNYMNVMATTNKIIQRGSMKKESQRFGVVDWEDDGNGIVEWVYFSFVIGQN